MERWSSVTSATLQVSWEKPAGVEIETVVTRTHYLAFLRFQNMITYGIRMHNWLAEAPKNTWTALDVLTSSTLPLEKR